MALNGKAALPTMEPDDYGNNHYFCQWSSWLQKIITDCSECSSVLEQLVTHVPDIIVHHSNDQSVPRTINSYGVVMFADISGWMIITYVKPL